MKRAVDGKTEDKNINKQCIRKQNERKKKRQTTSMTPVLRIIMNNNEMA